MRNEPQKPEWFELADGDAPSAQVRKVNKKLPAIAVLVTGAVIATGAFFANASENNQGDDQVTQADFQPGNNLPGVGLSDTSTPNGMTDPGTTGDRKGHIAPPGVGDPSHNDGDRPQWGDDGDDDDGEHQFGDRPPHREGEEHHERGERGERGTAPVIPNTTSGTTSKSA